MAKVKKSDFRGQTVNDQKQEEVENLKNRLARVLADYQNLVRRFEKERVEVVLRANKNLLGDLLPIIDNLERAQEHLNDQGLQMALDQFLKILQNYGVELIKVAAGDKFESTLHEAIDSAGGGQKETVAEVAAKGYRWQDGGVIRPAKVIVYSDKS